MLCGLEIQPAGGPWLSVFVGFEVPVKKHILNRSMPVDSEIDKRGTLMKELTHFIGGNHVRGTSGRFGEGSEPMTGEVISRVPLASKAEVRAAVENAIAAQPTCAARFGYLWHEWIGERWRPIAPAFARPNPAEWSDNRLTAAWLGHATVLINFFGIKILTDPVLFPRIGIRLPGLTVGPKRMTAPALTVRDLPKIDIVLLSHAHFDHFDMRTLHRFNRSTTGDHRAADK
jgi:Beta-lactamase superfamily domain